MLLRGPSSYYFCEQVPVPLFDITLLQKDNEYENDNLMVDEWVMEDPLLR